MRSEAAGARGLRWAAWIVIGALLLLSLGLAARFAGTSAEWLNYPYPRPGSEGLILYESLLVKNGGDIYTPITPEQFISGPYPPIYYWLAAAILPDKLPDFSTPGTVTSIFMPGRVVSLLATVVTALLLPVFVIFSGGFMRRGRSATLAAGLSGALAAILFLSMPQVMVWATRFRGDMLMIALTAAGLTCTAIGGSSYRRWRTSQSEGNPESETQNLKPRIRNPESETQNPKSKIAWPWLILGAIFFSLAFYTKQTALAGPIAAALYLFLLNWRDGVKWCVAMGALVLAPFVILDLATGNWFYLKLVTYHSLPLRTLTLTRLLQLAFWEDEWPLIVPAVAEVVGFAILYIKSLRHSPQPQAQIRRRSEALVPLFILAATITLPTGAVVGADHNHLLMPGLAVAAGVGTLLAQLLAGITDHQLEFAGNESRPPYPAFNIIAGAAATLLVAIYILFTSEPSSWYSPDLVMPGADQQEQLRKIVLNVSRNPGTLFFSDDPGLLALAGKKTNYDDPFTMAALATEGRWDESAYRDHLAHGDFSLLLLSCDVNDPATCRSDTFTPGVLDAIRSGYDVLFRDIVFTYAPKK